MPVRTSDGCTCAVPDFGFVGEEADLIAVIAASFMYYLDQTGYAAGRKGVAQASRAFGGGCVQIGRQPHASDRWTGRRKSVGWCTTIPLTYPKSHSITFYHVESLTFFGLIWRSLIWHIGVGFEGDR
jgi:hypothetical protein